jgi:hypothetical protein
MHHQVVMFVNHKQPNCGVYQFFKRMTKPLLDIPDTYYIETNEEWEHDYWLNELNPDIIVYNFYYSGTTMPWLSTAKIAAQSNRQKQGHRCKQLCIHHEGEVFNKGFDLILHQDPTNTDQRYFNLARPIPEYYQKVFTVHDTTFPVVGTFGFGLGGKGFTRVVETVQNEYDTALIRMNIAYAHFGDSNGDGARHWANLCRGIIKKEGIQLQITHDLLEEELLLDWLAQNTVNCFFYDHNGGRGLSGTTDYALAVRRPIAITESDQFRHLWRYDRRILIEENSLKDIINTGASYLEKFHAMWNTQTLIDSFRRAFVKVKEL